MKKIKSIFFLLVFVALSFYSSAQCSMCKAAAESSLKNGGGLERGVNNGIIYLMAVPYILLAMFCYIFRADISRVYHNWRGTKPEALQSIFAQYRFLFVFFAALSVLFLTFSYVQLSK